MTTAIHTSPSVHSKIPGVALGVSLALSAGAIALSVVAITTDDVGGSGGSGPAVATASVGGPASAAHVDGADAIRLSEVLQEAWEGGYYSR